MPPERGDGVGGRLRPGRLHPARHRHRQRTLLRPRAPAAASAAVPAAASLRPHPGPGLVADQRQCLHRRAHAHLPAGPQLAHPASAGHCLRPLHLPVPAQSLHPARRRHRLPGRRLPGRPKPIRGQKLEPGPRQRPQRPPQLPHRRGHGRGQRAGPPPALQHHRHRLLVRGLRCHRRLLQSLRHATLRRRLHQPGGQLRLIRPQPAGRLVDRLRPARRQSGAPKSDPLHRTRQPALHRLPLARPLRPWQRRALRLRARADRTRRLPGRRFHLRLHRPRRGLHLWRRPGRNRLQPHAAARRRLVERPALRLWPCLLGRRRRAPRAQLHRGGVRPQ